MITLAAQSEQLLTILLVVVLSLIGSIGFGAVALLLRAILPGVGRTADASLARLGTKRLLLVGILPIVGAALIGRAVEAVNNDVVGGIYGLVVVLPLGLATLVGAMAALPYLGGQVHAAPQQLQ